MDFASMYLQTDFQILSIYGFLLHCAFVAVDRLNDLPIYKQENRSRIHGAFCSNSIAVSMEPYARGYAL
jgi:hypothetical protein